MDSFKMSDVAASAADGRISDAGGLHRVVLVTSALDILQAQEAVLAIGKGLGLRPQDVNVAVAAVSRMASALLTYCGEATLSFAPAKDATGLEVEAHGGIVKCDSDRRRLEAGIIRLLGNDDWTVPAGGRPRVSARKTFPKNEEKRAWTNLQAY